MIKLIVNFIKHKIFRIPTSSIAVNDIAAHVVALERRVESLNTLVLRQSELLQAMSSIQYNLATDVYGSPLVSFTEGDDVEESSVMEAVLLAAVDDDEFLN